MAQSAGNAAAGRRGDGRVPASDLRGLGALVLLGALLSPLEKGGATLTFDYFIGLLAHGNEREGTEVSNPAAASQA